MKTYNIADASSAPEGWRRIQWARSFMPVLRLVEEKHRDASPLSGLTVGVCLHLEAKTACLLRTLQSLGATVAAAGSNPLSTQDPICAALVEAGVHVFSWHGMNALEYAQNIRDVLEYRPQLLIDDGGDLVAMVHETRRDLICHIRGGCEETTTGIKRLRAMEAQQVLSFPMIAVNDAYSKYLFDNRYGTGQSVWDGIMRATNLLVAGKAVVVIGYGWCGHGVALRAKGLGARVVVVEVDPHRALEAVMDGFEVMDLIQASKIGDFFITVTGNLHVVRREHFELMKDGAVLANAGHFDVEFSLSDLEALSVEIEETRENIRTYQLKNGRKLHLLAEGRLVNLASGDGHPIEIMDLSFALQLLCVLHLAHSDVKGGLLPVPEKIDKEVAQLKLESMDLRLEKLTEEQKEYLKSWRE